MTNAHQVRRTRRRNARKSAVTLSSLTCVSLLLMYACNADTLNV